METRPVAHSDLPEPPGLCRRHCPPAFVLQPSVMRTWPSTPLRSLHRAARKTAANVAPAPITTGEFYEHFLRCMPPPGWPARIVIANSGGPDSVCLLHLLSSVVRQRNSVGERAAFPSEVFSVHVNHNLQAANAAMLEVARDTAHKLGVKHRTETIPWGREPFPARPEAGQPIEEVARSARSTRLFMAMQALGAQCIAYAHHADDQVETSIMRLVKGSQMWGAAGMLPVRRWGMGSPQDIVPAGAAGMFNWVIRPLLNVSKDRNLATCETHDLEYAIDLTNFQPDITLRNSVRAYLQERESQLASGADTLVTPSWLNEEDAQSYEKAIERLQEIAPGTGSLSDLREATRQAGKEVERIDLQASNAMSQCVLPSPPSTVILAQEALSQVTDNDVRHAIVRRILRYVSPKPWGSVAAVAHGKTSNIQKIVESLWADSTHEKASLTLGGDVLWTPAALSRDGQLRLRAALHADEPALWVAHRAPPTRALEPTLTVDLTEQLRTFSGPRMLYLYDNRFWLRIDKEWASEGLSLEEVLHCGRVEVRPDTQFYLPQVVWVREGKEDIPLGRYAPAWRGVPWIQTCGIRVLTAL